VWQCGGIVEWVPCSHVAHIYRGPRTESVHPPGGHPYQSSIVIFTLEWSIKKKKFKQCF
jgi:hypothetical protein